MASHHQINNMSTYSLKAGEFDLVEALLDFERLSLPVSTCSKNLLTLVLDYIVKVKWVILP
jgi:hypothetical protein